MKCYEINVTLSVQYEKSDGKYHYMDPRCTTRTVRERRDATVYAWCESEDRAKEIALSVDYGPDIVTDIEVWSISVCEEDDSFDKEMIDEVIYEQEEEGN